MLQFLRVICYVMTLKRKASFSLTLSLVNATIFPQKKHTSARKLAVSISSFIAVTLFLLVSSTRDPISISCTFLVFISLFYFSRSGIELHFFLHFLFIYRLDFLLIASALRFCKLCAKHFIHKEIMTLNMMVT